MSSPLFFVLAQVSYAILIRKWKWIDDAASSHGDKKSISSVYRLVVFVIQNIQKGATIPASFWNRNLSPNGFHVAYDCIMYHPTLTSSETNDATKRMVKVKINLLWTSRYSISNLYICQWMILVEEDQDTSGDEIWEFFTIFNLRSSAGAAVGCKLPSRWSRSCLLSRPCWLPSSE